MTTPNFVIVGAPKTGTTALTEYLRQHPQVFISHPKEPHFFAEDLPSYRAATTLGEYERLFDAATEKHTAIGEASVFYLYSSVALDHLRRYRPDVRIIVMFRDVVAFLESMHSQLLYSCEETELSFQEARRLSNVRKTGHELPGTCREPKLLYYDEIGKFGAQYQRLLSLFPESQVLTIFFEDFSRDTSAVFSTVLRFLGVSDFAPKEFKRINERKMHKSRLIGRLIQRPPTVFASAVLGLKKLLGGRRLGITDALQRFNVDKRPKAEISPALRSEILATYQQDIALLEALTGRKLSSWR